MKKIIVYSVIFSLILNFGQVKGLIKTERARANGNTIVINEFVVDPKTGEQEWVELYNPSSTSVDVSGWRIKDQTGNYFGSTLSDSISADSYRVISVSSSILNNDNDSVKLFDSTGVNLIDEVMYGNQIGSQINAPSKGQSVGRFPNGLGTWSLFSIPTQGAKNQIPVPDRNNINLAQNPPGINDMITSNANASQAGLLIEIYADAALTQLITNHITVQEDGSFGSFGIGNNEYARVYLIAVDLVGGLKKISDKIEFDNDIVNPQSPIISSLDLDNFYKAGDSIHIILNYGEKDLNVSTNLNILDSTWNNVVLLDQGNGSYFLFTSLLSSTTMKEGTDIQLQFIAIDKYENSTTIDSSYKINLDKTVPSSSVSTLPPNTYTKTFSIPYIAEDGTGSGVDFVNLYYSYSADGNNWPLSSVQYKPDEIGKFSPSPITFNTDLANGDGYYKFYVLATDKAGNTQTEPQGYETTFIKARSIDTPTGFFATVSDNKVHLKWNPVPGAVRYEIERSGSPYVPIATNLPPDQTSYTDTGVVAGKTYNYKIIAYNAAGYHSEIIISTSIAKIVAIPEKTTAIKPEETQPETQIIPQTEAETITPEAQAEEPGKVLGDEKDEQETQNWTPLIVIISILILGIATYMGWKWYTEKGTEGTEKEDRW